MTSNVLNTPDLDATTRRRADDLCRQHQQQVYVRTDRMFAVLMIFQWLAGIAAAIWISPRTWVGYTASTHPHVWAAVFLDGLIISLPVTLAIFRPGRVLTRHLIAVGQMLTSAVLIHLTGGRIETHFHIFGSLAFLAFYRDWRILITASAVVTADHFLRGLFWPQSVYGVLTPGGWRWLEHAGWVVFEDVILIRACVQGVHEMQEISAGTALLEAKNSLVERALADLRNSQAELERARDAAEAANRAKSEFLANMSHEIRTPINGIVGMTELALDTPLTRAQREYLESVQSCSDSLLSVVNDILDFSKIEAGKLSLEPVGFSLGESLGNTMKTLGLRAHQKNLELAYHILPNVPDELIGDSGRLRQVVVNLVGNAIKFTERGEVIVRVGVESKSDDDVSLHIAVTDTGIGIPADKQRLVFNAFEQADASTTRTYGGTGLGLAIASKLVAMMGGRIWVESEAGRGSTFHFTAHFALDRSAEPRPARTARAELRDVRVLIVDDNATNRRILEEVLRNWRMKPTAVDAGAAALTALDQACDEGQPYPLVLLDAQMPRMDGFMVAERIKSNPRTAETRLLMLSSAAQHCDTERCRRIGVAGYLAKPIKQSELLDGILALLGQREPNAEPSDKKRAPSQLAPKSAAGPARKLLTLVVEDNVVNQRVAVGILEKRGHTVVVVDNGRKALQALSTQRFDVVLMDVQMPEMDGLEATRAIRELEKQTGGHTTIIAMTARAMKGDRESCLESGMDGYVAKPIQPKELVFTIEKLLPENAGERANDEEPPSNSLPASPTAQSILSGDRGGGPSAGLSEVIDVAGLRERVEHDTDLLAEMIGLFLDTSPRLLTEIETGVGRGDGDAVRQAAHALKGAMQNMGAVTAADAAFRMETIGRTGDMESAADSLNVLKHEFERVEYALGRMAKEVQV